MQHGSQEYGRGEASIVSTLDFALSWYMAYSRVERGGGPTGTAQDVRSVRDEREMINDNVRIRCVPVSVRKIMHAYTVQYT